MTFFSRPITWPELFLALGIYVLGCWRLYEFDQVLAELAIYLLLGLIVARGNMAACVVLISGFLVCFISQVTGVHLWSMP